MRPCLLNGTAYTGCLASVAATVVIVERAGSREDVAYHMPEGRAAPPQLCLSPTPLPGLLGAVGVNSGIGF